MEDHPDYDSFGSTVTIVLSYEFPDASGTTLTFANILLELSCSPAYSSYSPSADTDVVYKLGSKITTLINTIALQCTQEGTILL